MTDEEARQLDAEVAEKVMGWTRHKLDPPRVWSRDDGGSYTMLTVLLDPQGERGVIPRYSTDFGAAGLVVEHLRQTRQAEWSMQSSQRGWSVICVLWSLQHGEGAAKSESLPDPICRAALAAVEGDQANV